MKKKRGGTGRRKVAIERIDNEDARNVCFSKRRSGLFNKANELATLCGAESVLVVYSPAGNLFSFGSPGVKKVADRFLLGTEGPTDPSASAHDGRAIERLNAECSRLLSRIEAEVQKKPLLADSLNSVVQQNHVFRFVNDVDGLGPDVLKQLQQSLDLMQASTHMRISEILLTGSESSFNVAMAAENPFGTRFY